MTYREWVEDTAASLGSDGCTGVLGNYRWCCMEHDIFCRTATQRDGTPITREQANKRFRSCIQRHSPFGFWSPMAWWRWLGVTLFGGAAPTRQAPYGLPRTTAVETPEQARRRIIAEVERAR